MLFLYAVFSIVKQEKYLFFGTQFQSALAAGILVLNSVKINSFTNILSVYHYRLKTVLYYSDEWKASAICLVIENLIVFVVLGNFGRRAFLIGWGVTIVLQFVQMFLKYVLFDLFDPNR